MRGKSHGVKAFAPINFLKLAADDAKNPKKHDEIEEIDAPQPPPAGGRKGLPVGNLAAPVSSPRMSAQAATSFGTGTSPGPKKTFQAEYVSTLNIPPDTMGAVGTTHVVSVTNDRMRITTREGVELSRMTTTSFWTGVTIKGQAVDAFDPKILFDRFNNRFIFVCSVNQPTGSAPQASGMVLAVSATADPTGTWYRYSAESDPTATNGSGGAGKWIDYPSVGFNKNWIVVDENTFKYTCSTTSPFPCSNTGFWGNQIFVFDKQAAYANTLGGATLFEADFANGCINAPDQSVALGCGFTMAPAITEDNTTDTVYMIEDWDATAGQLRISKITGTPSTPSITVGTQFPQSTASWRFDAVRISNRTTATTSGTITSSGGYMPQRQQSANLPSGTRVMANDSRIQNVVYRNGKLWATHTVMLAATTQPAGTTIGSLAIPDTHSGIQWWQIDPTDESGSTVTPLQRGRIEDPTADNCHNGTGGTNIVAGRCNSTATQTGEFFAYPNISVNQNDDVFIGFTRFSPLTYPNSAYVIRKSTDPVNTTRDVVVFRPGQANYNIGSGSSTATYPTNPTRANRWGDYSASQTDPLNDTDFWSVQEYSGTLRDAGLGIAGVWETWWALVQPANTAPLTSGSLLINEFRLRGPQGVRDEFVELYNPSSTPVIVNTTDGSEGWALVYSTNGTSISATVAVVPNGTVIPAHGHFLIADNPDASGAGGLPTAVYSLNSAKSIEARGATSDTGWALDLPDNGGLAIFKTSNAANYTNGNRMDSVGFSSIAAGLFKEGNGIPAITAATPTGQMTFVRNQSSGTSADTDTNENDFVFANTVVGETLGSTPKLGAAGPENLDSPIHMTGSTTLATALLDTAVGTGNAPNFVRDASAVTNGASGTMTFRRTFTNTTGENLTRLRFRIVDLTTNPTAFADLRALSIGSSVVSTTGGNVNVSGTTVEVPPTQAAGGGLNSTLSVSDITNTAPLASGSSINLQFQVGVQTTGAYTFCMVAEGLAGIPATSSTLCFSGNSENTAPSITAGSPISLARGASAAGTAIATVSDSQDSAGSLTVTAMTVPTGITVTNISNTGGNVTATINSSCSAVAGSNNIVFKVTDADGATATATFNVTITVPATPSITPGGPTTFCSGGSVTLTSSAASGYQWYLDGNAIGAATSQQYIATLSGSYTVAAVENGCPGSQSAAVVVTVNPLPSTPTASNTGAYLSGQTIQLSTPSVASAIYSWTGPNGFTSSSRTPSIAHAALVNAGTYSVTVSVSGCTSAAGTTDVIVGLRRSDLNGNDKSDIVLQNTSTNAVAAWLMDDNTIVEGKTVATPAAGVQVVATGDTDGDSKADMILKNNNTGTISVWKMNGTSLVSGTNIATPNINQRVVGTYDFNHDGKADIVLQNTATGAVSLWIMNGGTLVNGIALGTQPATTRAVALGYFGGDAIVFQDTVTNAITRWTIVSNAVALNQTIATPASDWKVVAAADFNNDANSDLALQNASTRTVAVWLMAADGVTISLGANVATPVAGWSVVGAGDYDGNGKGDLLLHNSSTSGIAQWQMDGTTISKGWNISTLAGWKPLAN